MRIFMPMDSQTTVDKITLESLFFRMNAMESKYEKIIADKDAKYEAIIADKDAQILKLTHELAQLKKMIFGSKSERFVPASLPEQLTMGFEPDAIFPDQKIQQVSYVRKEPAKPAVHQGRKPLPAGLLREQIVIQPKADVAGMKKIGEEITEELEYTPGKLFVRQYVRPKYADPKTGGVVCGELPERPITKGIAGPALLSHIVINKFVDHLPIYRQVQQFAREGVNLSPSTINDWLAACCNLLQPLYDQMLNAVVSTNYILADETPIKVMDKAKKGTTHRGYHWLYYSPEIRIVYFDYRQGRSREGPREILESFSGFLGTDGYSGYDMFDNNKRITRLCCWAHARRKFDESLQNDQARATLALQQIQQLYQIERTCKENRYSHEQIREIRQQKALPILNTFKEWLVQNYREVLPSSVIGKAIAYTLNLWDKLTVYLQDGKLHIDNNGVENAVRPSAIGKKNYLFAGSHEGAKRAAMLYTFMGSCKMNNINPQEWLTDILERIPSHKANKLKELMPNNWTKPTA
jgi:transposase